MMIMKHVALFVGLLPFCTGCMDNRVSFTAGGANNATTNSSLVLAMEKSGLSPPNEYGTQKANVDPETGEWVSPSEHDGPVDAEPVEASALNRSAEKMEEKPSPAPGGGMMIDLKGRFRSPIAATIESNGKTKIEHPANEKKQ
jgi:hypothetical protein